VPVNSRNFCVCWKQTNFKPPPLLTESSRRVNIVQVQSLHAPSLSSQTSVPPPITINLFGSTKECTFSRTSPADGHILTTEMFSCDTRLWTFRKETTNSIRTPQPWGSRGSGRAVEIQTYRILKFIWLLSDWISFFWQKAVFLIPFRIYGSNLPLLQEGYLISSLVERRSPCGYPRP
jgi:hypothetical protein